MRTTLLYGQAVATQNSVDFIEFPANTRLHGFNIMLRADIDADLEFAQWEISTVPYLQINQNEAKGILALIGVGGNLTTSGAMRNIVNHFQPVDHTVKAGERVYLNAYLNGTSDSTCGVVIHHS